MERNKDYDDFIDKLESILAENPYEVPFSDIMTPGLYCRSIAMPAGIDLVSKIHKTEHMFYVGKGTAVIANENEGIIIVEAPFMQITVPGTRRIITAITDVIWSTFHSVKYNFTHQEWQDMPEEQKESIRLEWENEVIEPHTNLLLNDEKKEAIE